MQQIDLEELTKVTQPVVEYLKTLKNPHIKIEINRLKSQVFCSIASSSNIDENIN